MRKTTALFFVLLFMVLPACLSAQSKIGYVSVDEVFAAMPETKKADGDLAEFQKALQDSYAQYETELNTAMEKFVKDSSKLSPAVKEARRQDMQARISELQNKQTQFNTSLEAEKEKLLKPIREKLIASIKQVAKEMGYEHVLYKESAIVFPDAADITAAVKKKLGIK
jgi:outer membrane protein